MHRRIATNDFLTKIGVRDNPNCSFCNEEQEKLLHLFRSFPKVASLRHDLTETLTFLHITPEHYAIDPLVALGLKPDSSKNHQPIYFFLPPSQELYPDKQKKENTKWSVYIGTLFELQRFFFFFVSSVFLIVIVSSICFRIVFYCFTY